MRKETQSTKERLILLTVALVGISSSPASCGAEPKRPNVLFIISDDLNNSLVASATRS